MTIGERIKYIRKLRGISQKSLAKQINLSPSFLCDVENGRTNLPVNALIALAQITQTTVAYLVGETEIEYPLPQNAVIIAQLLSESKEGSELLQSLADFNNWSDADKSELLSYLHAKSLVRGT